MPHGNGGPRGLAGYRSQRFVNPYDDLFNGVTLDPKWTQSATSPGPTVSGGAVSFSSLNNGRHIYQALAADAPANFTLYARVSALSATGGMTGLFLVDSGGAGFGFSPYNSPNGLWSWGLSAFNYSTSGSNVTLVNPDMWLRVRKVGTTYYGAGATHNSSVDFANQSYGGETTGLVNTASISKIGYGSFYTAGGTHTATLEEFRFVAN